MLSIMLLIHISDRLLSCTCAFEAKVTLLLQTASVSVIKIHLPNNKVYENLAKVWRMSWKQPWLQSAVVFNVFHGWVMVGVCWGGKRHIMNNKRGQPYVEQGPFSTLFPHFSVFFPLQKIDCCTRYYATKLKECLLSVCAVWQSRHV